TIFEEVIDERTGAVVVLPVPFGTASGIERVIELSNDALTDRPLVNNQPYYFAVTAYSYNDEDPEATPRQLESTPRILEIRPKTTDPGYRAGADFKENLQVLHTEGVSTGSVLVRVIDQNNLTGDSYAVTFESIGKVDVDFYGDILEFDNYAWNLTNSSTNQRLIDKASAFGGLETDYFTLDGFQIGVQGSGHYKTGEEILRVEWEGGPQVYLDYFGFWLVGWDFFGSSIMPYEVKTVVEVRFDRNTSSKGYVYLRGSDPNYAYQGYYDSPMTIWDVTDSDNPRQISFALVEQEGVAAKNNQFNPTANPGDREYLFILDETYSETPNPAYTGDFTILANADQMPILYAAWSYQGPAADGSTFPWQNGDIWRWIPNVAFDSDDVFTFTTPKASFSVEAAKADVDDIQVFPNPYLASNEQELNKYQRFVTFNHLPERASFRVYTVDGTLVRSFEKNDGSQLATWDLQNDNGLPVASGMYIIHIEMPDLGTEKVLKLGVVSEAQYLDRI
ncbi:MAG: T9SS type A sorting domain-containing protein, partial [Bacteroidetes bacterium]|nr:T9SS type A sorting domain-containing protein [Bacteroidota bacterium]